MFMGFSRVSWEFYGIFQGFMGFLWNFPGFHGIFYGIFKGLIVFFQMFEGFHESYPGLKIQHKCGKNVEHDLHMVEVPNLLQCVWMITRG